MQNSNDHKQMIQQGFDTVAAGYDHPSLPFFPETAKRLVKHLQLKPADYLLDECTGTGEAYSPMADIFIKRYESTGRVVPPLLWRRLAAEELIREQFSAIGLTKVDIHHEALAPEMFSESIQLFDQAFKAINPSKVNLGKFRRQLSKEFIENYTNYTNMDELELIEVFMELTS